MAYHSSLLDEGKGDSATKQIGRDGSVWSVLLYLVYFYALSRAYVDYLYPVWAYAGFDLRDEPALTTSQALIISAFSLILPTKRDVRSYLIHILFLIKVIPSAVLYAHSNVDPYYMKVVYGTFAIILAASAIPLNFRTARSFDPVVISVVLLVSTFLLIFAILATGGGRYFSLSLSSVYDFRREASVNFGTLINYLIPIFSKTAIPFGVVVAMIYRKWLLLAWYFFAAVLLFGLAHHKGILFYPFITFGIYFFMARFGSVNYIKLAAVLAVFVGLFGISVLGATDPTTGSVWSWYASLLVRRALLVPALLDSQYIEFFSENPWYLWSSSRLSFGLIDRVYDVSPPFLIGESYYQSFEMSANTGFVGSGFAQMGLWGSIIYSLGVGLVIAFLSAMGRQKGVAFVAAMVSVQMLTMYISTDFVTMFMTHGMIITMLMLLLMERPARQLPSDGNKA